ncbi:peptidase S10 [Enterovirga sp.]|uniref:S10 family peptidase n=1 Tax=Enterovirga sp. TaxID=2026350 RepID=UPI00262A9DF1|nr:peptidase S10 [Enterovirga sp.]MDB5591880.1 peptidase [Enterovirga sp.]
MSLHASARWFGLLLCGLLAAGPAQAQPAPAQQRVAAPEGRRLPADSTTKHRLDLPGRSLDFVAVAGSLPLTDQAGAVQAEVAVTSYRLAGADPATRPVTFAVNGGPGASSAYLHLLVAGPWRLPVDGASISPSAPPALVPNAETWLDFTDLVFIDPVGTGYSRANGPDEQTRDRYFSVEGDISALAAVVARWLRENERLGSPKFFLGESYGGFRGPLLAQKLQEDTGIGLSGLVLVSPVFDFGWLSEPRWKPMEFVTRLPSLVAAARERRGPLARADLAEAESYASGEYLLDLLRGPGDAVARDRMVARVAGLTGLDPALVSSRGGRLDLASVQRELGRPEGRVASAYDAGVSTFDPDPSAATSQAEDAGLAPLRAVLSSAAVDHSSRRLRWPVPNARYELLNGSVNGQWRFGRGRRPAESFSELRGALALDGNMRVLVAHGLTDLVTPYFGSELILRQLPAFAASRSSLATYPGGHMFYTRDTSRAAFREDARSLYEAALAARAGARRGG